MLRPHCAFLRVTQDGAASYACTMSSIPSHLRPSDSHLLRLRACARSIVRSGPAAGCARRCSPSPGEILGGPSGWEGPNEWSLTAGHRAQEAP
jgi:hypothetical protein